MFAFIYGKLTAIGHFRADIMPTFSKIRERSKTVALSNSVSEGLQPTYVLPSLPPEVCALQAEISPPELCSD